MTESDKSAERSYGCSFACGNPYDYVFVDVKSAETLMLCLPCFARLASDIVATVIDAENPITGMVPGFASPDDTVGVPGPAGKRRGKNAPANSDDPALFEAFEGRLLPEDLPEEFR